MSSSAYSSILHLAHASFLSIYDDENLMVMLAAYFDESEAQKGTKVMTVAGFVSTVEKWVKFEAEWNVVLNQYEVPYLHMKEFAHSTKVFESWKGKSERRRSFLVDLIKVAKKRVHKGVSLSVRLEDFEEINQRYKLQEQWGCPYSLSGMGAVTSIIGWKQKHHPTAPIKYYFEDGHPGRIDLSRCLDSESCPYNFSPKKEKQNGIDKWFPPFQLADLAAYENSIGVSRIHDGEYDVVTDDDPVKLLRGSFQSLLTQVPSMYSVISKDNLEKMCLSKNLART